MRISAKAEYAVRAMVELAVGDGTKLLTAGRLAKAQAIPAKFLPEILTALGRGGLVRGRRGRHGGYELTRPATQISIADVLRCIDGSLVSVHDVGLNDLPYYGPTAALADVWMALRASMRHVLERTSLADIATSALPADVRRLAAAETAPGAGIPSIMLK